MRKIMRFTHERIKIMRDVINERANNVIMETNEINTLREELVDHPDEVKAHWDAFIAACNAIKKAKNTRSTTRAKKPPTKKRRTVRTVETELECVVDELESEEPNSFGA